MSAGLGQSRFLLLYADGVPSCTSSCLVLPSRAVGAALQEAVTDCSLLLSPQCFLFFLSTGLRNSSWPCFPSMVIVSFAFLRVAVFA